MNASEKVNESVPARSRRKYLYGLIFSLLIVVGLAQIGWIRQALAQRIHSPTPISQWQNVEIAQATSATDGAFIDRHVLANPLSSELQELVAKLRGLARGLATEEPPQELKDELRKLITEQFDERHQSQRQRLENILLEAKNMEDALKRREEQKEEIISRRMLELLGESDPLDWDYQPVSSPGLSPQTGPAAGGTHFPPSAYRPANRPSGAAPSLPSLPNSPRSARAPSVPSPASAGEPALTLMPAPASGLRNPNDSMPTLARSDVNDPFASPAATLPNPVVASNDDFISVAYRLKGLQEKSKETEQLFIKGATTSAELRDIQNSLEEARAQWEFKMRDLQRQVEAAHIGLKAAEENLQRLKDLPSDSKQKEQVREAQPRIKMWQLHIQRIAEQLDWMEEFKEKAKIELSNSSDASSPASSAAAEPAQPKLREEEE